MLLNLFQVRLRAREAPEGHRAEGSLRAEPSSVHPGEDLEVVVDVSFIGGGPPGSIEVKVSPPEDFDVGEPEVRMGPEGAKITIHATTDEEVELGTYYLQVVYSDDDREHFEAEAALDLERHWVRIGRASASPARASPGDPIELSATLSFEGQARVRGHVRGRLVPEDWDGSDDTAIRLARERSSVTGTRDQVWSVRLPRGIPDGHYHADVEFSSQEGTARRRTREVLHVVPPRAMGADEPRVEPALLAPGDEVVVRTRAENLGKEPLEVMVAAEMVPEAGGSSLPLEEVTVPLGPGQDAPVEWTVSAPERPGRWSVRVRARAERTDGADPPPALLDVRPPHMVHVVGAVPARPWAAPGEVVEIALQLTDSGSRPGHDTSVSVSLEGDLGERSTGEWSGWAGPDVEDTRVPLEVPGPLEAAGEGEELASSRFTLVVRDRTGRELLRTPGAVAVRRRVSLEPVVLRRRSDPLRLGDALLPGERVRSTSDAGELTLVELTSGCRIYAKGDAVVGVDPELPMDEDFWDEALDADLRLYTDLKAGIGAGARSARAEAVAMRAIATSLGGTEGHATRTVKDGRELAKNLDPDRRARGVRPRSGPLAPLAAWLSDPDAPASRSVGLVGELRRELMTTREEATGEDALRSTSAAARAAADHLDRLAELMERACEEDRMDVGSLRGAAALVAAAGVAQVELARTREAADPWPTPLQSVEMSKSALQSMSAQLGSMVEVLARHRTRRSACTVNTALRATYAAIVRDLEVQAPDVTGHSGDATDLEMELANRSSHDLELRLNVALPSRAWAVLEPQGKGSRGLHSIGPVHVPARSSERVTLVLYVPTTVRLDRYVLPVEVVPEPRDLLPEQRGDAR